MTTLLFDLKGTDTIWRVSDGVDDLDVTYRVPSITEVWLFPTVVGGAMNAAVSMAVTGSMLAAADRPASAASSLSMTQAASAGANRPLAGSESLSASASSVMSIARYMVSAVSLALTNTMAASASKPMAASVSMSMAGSFAVSGVFEMSSAQSMSVTTAASPGASRPASAAGLLSVIGALAASSLRPLAASVSLALSPASLSMNITRYMSSVAALAVAAAFVAGVNRPMAAAASVSVTSAAAMTVGSTGPTLLADFLKSVILSNGSPGVANNTTTPTAWATSAFDAFDRTDHARQWGSDGVLKYAPHNYTVEPDDLSQANWTKRGTATAVFSSGSTEIDNLGAVTVDDVYDILTLAGGVAGDPYSISFMMKTVSTTGTLRISNPASVSKLAIDIDLSLVSTSAFELIDYDHAAVTVTTPGTNHASTNGIGWFFFKQAGASKLNFHVKNLQCNMGTVPNVYIDTTTTAPSYAARAGAENCEPVTNLFEYPEQLDTGWTNVGSTSDSSGATDPNGGTNAFNLVTANATTNQGIEQAGVECILDKYYTVSVYVSADEVDMIQISGQTTNSVFDANDYCNFDVGGAAVGTEGSGVIASGMVAVGDANSYYRCWCTFQAEATAAATVRLNLIDSTSEAKDGSIVGNGSDDIQLFGLMFNEGGLKDYVGTTNRIWEVAADSDLTDAGWTDYRNAIDSNDTTAPDGSSNADEIRNDGAATALAAVGTVKGSGHSSFVSGTVYFASVFAKKNSKDYIAVGSAIPHSAGTTNYYTWFKVSDGTLGTKQSQIDDCGIIPYGNGWYRCWIKLTCTGTTDKNGIIFGPEESDNSHTVTADGLGNWFWGSQIDLGNAAGDGPAPYVGWGAAQTSFLPMGYLAEDNATNLITDSEDLTAAAWTINNTDSFTATADQSVGPDGVSSLDEIKITDTTSETHLISDTITITSAADYVMSGFVRADEQRWVGLNISGASEEFVTVVWDLYAGTQVATDVGTTSGTINDSGISHVGDGLWFVWVSFKITETSVTAGFASYASASPTFDANGLESYAGTANDKFYAGHVQFETGTYPSSYIKTSGGTDSRASDDLDLATSGYLQDSGGVVVADFETWKEDADLAAIVADTDATSKAMGVDASEKIAIDAGTVLATTNAITRGVRAQAASGWQASDNAQSVFLNGDGTRTADTNYDDTIITAVMGIGYEDATADDYIKGPIRRLELWDEYRTEAQMQTSMDNMVGTGL